MKQAVKVSVRPGESMSDEDGLEDVCANPSNADCID